MVGAQPPISKERPVRKMTVLGASALLVAGLVASPAAAFAAPVLTGSEYLADVKVCADYDSEKQEPTGDPAEVTATAPEGQLISGYCVKAGSVKQGAGEGGVYFVELDEPVASVVITYPWGGGRDISHYALVYTDAVTEPTPGPAVPADEPAVPVAPVDEPTVPAEEPVDETGGEPAEPAAPTEGGAGLADGPAAPAEAVDSIPSAPSEEPEELAATGASTAIGFALIALALVGGGVTLIVLRRKGALGS